MSAKIRGFAAISGGFRVSCPISLRSRDIAEASALRHLGEDVPRRLVGRHLVKIVKPRVVPAVAEHEVAVAFLDAVMGVAQVDAVALLTAQQRLEGLLHAGLAHIVAAPVVRMVLDVVGVHFRNVTQQVAAGVEGIGARGARHTRETREEETLLDEHVVLFARDLALEHQGLVADLPAVEPVLPELVVDERRVETEDLAKS